MVLAAGFVVFVVFGAAFFAVFGAAALAALGFSTEVFFTLSSLARRARLAFLREAVFFFKRSFLTALSSSLWIFLMFSAVGLALKFF